MSFKRIELLSILSRLNPNGGHKQSFWGAQLPWFLHSDGTANVPYCTADQAPRVGHTEAVPRQLTACAPPNENCALPSENCAAKKLTGSGLLERKSRSKSGFFVDWHRIFWRFWDEDLFFFEITCFWPEKPLEFLAISVKTFFFLFLEITCFWPEKPLEFPISDGKSLWLFAPHFAYLIQTGINFLCPRASLEFTQNKLLVSPQNLFLPPQSRYPGSGPVVPYCYPCLPLIVMNHSPII